MVFLYCFLRLNLKTRILSPRPLPTMVALTVPPPATSSPPSLKDRLGGKFDFGADVAGQFFHADNIAGSYPVLFSAGFDNRVHNKASISF